MPNFRCSARLLAKSRRWGRYFHIYDRWATGKQGAEASRCCLPVDQGVSADLGASRAHRQYRPRSLVHMGLGIEARGGSERKQPVCPS